MAAAYSITVTTTATTVFAQKICRGWNSAIPAKLATTTKTHIRITTKARIISGTPSSNPSRSTIMPFKPDLISLALSFSILLLLSHCMIDSCRSRLACADQPRLQQVLHRIDLLPGRAHRVGCSDRSRSSCCTAPGWGASSRYCAWCRARWRWGSLGSPVNVELPTNRPLNAAEQVAQWIANPAGVAAMQPLLDDSWP